MRAPALGLAIAALLGIAINARGQQIGQVRGYVHGPDNQPVSGAIVRFERLETDLHTDLKTDKKGFYQISTIMPGIYTVTVTVDGKLRARRTMYRINIGGQDPTDIANGDSSSGLVFKLNPPDGPIVESRSELEGNMESDASAKRGKGKAAGNQPEPGGGATAAPPTKPSGDRRGAPAPKPGFDAAMTAGNSAMNGKNYDAAIASYSSAVEIDAAQGFGWAALADAYMRRSSQRGAADKTGDRGKAEEAFQKAIALSPNNAAYYQSYALALVESGKPDEARANLAKAIAVDPGGAATYHLNLGSLLLNQGQTDAALEEFRKSIESDPNHASSYYQYGVALAGKATVDSAGKLKPPPGCVDALKKYLELQPNGADAAAARDMIAAMGGK